MTWRKIFQRTAAIFLIVAGLLSSATVHAEIKTYKGIGDYPSSNDTLPKDAKDRAKLYAERDTLEQAGIFIKTFLQTKNYELIDDEIISIAGTILKIIDTTFEIIPLNDKAGIKKYRAVVVAQIDTDKVEAAFEKWMSRDQNERSNITKQNEELQKIINEQNKKIKELEEKVANVKTKADKKKIREEIVTIDKETLYAQKLDEANKLMEAAKYENAALVYTEIIKLNPNDSNTYFSRGYAYDGLKQYERAIQDFDNAIQINPNYAEAYYSRGLTYYFLEQYEQAIQDFNKALQLNPNYAEAYNHRGTVYAKLGQYDQSIQDCDKAIQINPNYAEVYYNRGLDYALIGNFNQAIEDVTKAIQLKPNYAVAYQLRGMLYEDFGDAAKAQADFTKAKELGYNS